MKGFVVKGINGGFLRKTRSQGYNSREWVDNVWDATIYRKKNHASCVAEVQGNPAVAVVVEVEVRVKIVEPKK